MCKNLKSCYKVRGLKYDHKIYADKSAEKRLLKTKTRQWIFKFDLIYSSDRSKLYKIKSNWNAIVDCSQTRSFHITNNILSFYIF